MPLPSSGTISFQNFNTEMGQSSTYSSSMSWINSNAKVADNSVSGHYGKAWYQKNNAGNCNNGNCSNCCANCNCGAIAFNCYVSGNVNCVNCDSRAWLQTNCNCACTYNGSQTACVCTNCYDCSCFLAGSLVRMADGRLLPIEEVRIGDFVMGGYGEANEVLALDRPLLGNRPMAFINGDHATTLGHPHFRTDRTFGVVGMEEYLNNEQGSVQPVVVADGSIEMWALPGLPDEMLDSLTPLETGQMLHHLDGPRAIETLDVRPLPVDTQLYNLVLAGSHTYFVDGYLVSGFFNAQDFDYATWTPKARAWTRDDYFRTKCCGGYRKAA